MKRADQRKHHYIYKITRDDGKYYIGMHSTDNLEDGYFGSGKLITRSIKKHGLRRHSKEILEHMSTREALKVREREIVNEELLGDVLCMNLQLGGGGGWSTEQQSLNGTRGNEKMRKLRLENPDWAKQVADAQSRAQKLVYAQGRKPTLPTWTGRKHRSETLEKLKTSMSGKQSGERNSQFGIKRVGINKDGKIKKVQPHQLQEYLDDGWKKGFGHQPDRA